MWIILILRLGWAVICGKFPLLHIFNNHTFDHTILCSCLIPHLVIFFIFDIIIIFDCINGWQPCLSQYSIEVFLWCLDKIRKFILVYILGYIWIFYPLPFLYIELVLVMDLGWVHCVNISCLDFPWIIMESVPLQCDFSSAI